MNEITDTCHVSYIYLLKRLLKRLLRGQRSLILCGLTDFMVSKMGAHGK